MSVDQEFASKKLELKDVKNFKLLIMVFMVLKVLAILSYLFLPLISAIFYDVGTFLLLLGMRVLSKNQDDLNSATKTSVIFLLAMGLIFISAIMITIYPYTAVISASETTTLANLANLETSFGVRAFVVAAIVLFAGLCTVVASIFFDGWYNETMQPEKPFKLYHYVGFIFAFGEVVTFAGYVFLQRAILEVLNGIAGYATEGVNFSYLVIYIGLFILLVSVLFEIYAGYALMKRMSKVQTA